ncbi:MAG: hypothetical protein ABEH77_03560 [Halobacteriaceae archaeon]
MAEDIQPHIYAGQITDDAPIRENILGFAERHGFDIAGASVDADDPESSRGWLQACRDRGLDVMINNGAVEGAPGNELATDPDKLREPLDNLRDVLEVYADYYPEGGCFVWHEEPLMGNWEGDSLSAKADQMVEYGPVIFEAMREVAAEVAPGVDLGIFIHQPFVAGAEHTDNPAFTRLVDRLRDRDAMPDFAYIDTYRGYYEWEGGYEATNEYLHSILSNAKSVMDGRPVYYLGEAHTINNLYTPSKQAIQGNFRTAAEAGVDGYGWWVRGSHRVTHDRNYNPFLPNRGTDQEPDEYTSWTGARDRLLWANLLLHEHTNGIDRADKFDLWVHGHDMELYETRVELKAGDGWEHVGDVSGYVSGPLAYDPAGREWVSVLHCLDRERYLDGGLELRLTGRDDSDGADIHGVHAVPYSGTTHYHTEPELADAIGDLDLPATALGGTDLDTTVGAGEQVTATAAVEHPDRVVEETPLAVDSDDLDRLADIEAETDDHTGHFDLWVYGTNLDDARVFLQDSGLELSEVEVTDRAERNGRALVVRGLEKEAFYNYETTGHFVWPRIAAEGGVDVRAVYVMPYHGTDNPKTPGDIADIVEREFTEGQGQLNRFAIGGHVSPVSNPVGGEDFEAWVHVVDRHIYEQQPFDYHPSLGWPPWYLQD